MFKVAQPSALHHRASLLCLRGTNKFLFPGDGPHHVVEALDRRRRRRLLRFHLDVHVEPLPHLLDLLRSESQDCLTGLPVELHHGRRPPQSRRPCARRRSLRLAPTVVVAAAAAIRIIPPASIAAPIAAPIPPAAVCAPAVAAVAITVAVAPAVGGPFAVRVPPTATRGGARSLVRGNVAHSQKSALME